MHTKVADSPAAVDPVVALVKFSHQFVQDIVVSADDNGILHFDGAPRVGQPRRIVQNEFLNE